MRNHARGFFCVKNRLKLKVYSSKTSSFTSYFLIHFLLRTALFDADCHGSRRVEPW